MSTPIDRLEPRHLMSTIEPVFPIGRGGAAGPVDAIAFEGQAVFNYYNRDRGTEPWISNGTPNGTRLLADFWSSADFAASDLAAAGNTLWATRGIYNAAGERTGVGLATYRSRDGGKWRTVAIPGGAQIDITADTLRTVGDRLVATFVVAGERTDYLRDGTTDTWKPILLPQPPDSVFVDDHFAVGSQLYVRRGESLYRLTEQAERVTASAIGTVFSTPAQQRNAQRALALAVDELGNERLLSIDASGAVATVANPASGVGFALADRILFVEQNRLYRFGAGNGEATLVTTLFARDPGKTYLSFLSAGNDRYAVINVRIVAGDDAPVDRYFVTDGTAAGTHAIANASPYSISMPAFTAGAGPFFVGTNAQQHALLEFRPDGTLKKTTAVSDRPTSLTPMGPLLALELTPADSLSRRVVVVSDHNNTPPTAAIVQQGLFAEGGPLALSAAGSSDAEGTITAFRWDLDNDGSFDDGTTRSPSISVPWALLVELGFNGDSAPRTVRVRVTDTAGASSVASVKVTAADVAPTASLAAPPQAKLNAPFALAWTATDVGGDQPTSYTVDWGDGTRDVIAPTTNTATHTYRSAGKRRISLAVTDRDGTHWIASQNVSVVPQFSGVTPVLFTKEVWTEDDVGLGEAYVRGRLIRRVLSDQGEAQIVSIEPGVADQTILIRSHWNYRIFNAEGVAYVFAATEEARDTISHEIWRTDGTATGTSKIATGWFDVAGAKTVGRYLFVPQIMPPHGERRLIVTAGRRGTTSHARYGDGTYVRAADAPVAFANAIYTVASRARGTLDLVRLDPANDWTTSVITRLHDRSDSGRIRAIGGRLLIEPDTTLGGAGVPFMQSDGTAGGTFRLRSSTGSANPVSFFGLGNLLVATASSDAAGTELWMINRKGVASLVSDLAPGATGSYPQFVGTAGRHIVFSARTTALGRELYRTDGTPGGTALLGDLTKGRGSTQFHAFRPTASTQPTLYFTATYHDGVASRTALFSTDGLRLTMRSDPSRLAVAKSSLFAAGQTIRFAATNLRSRYASVFSIDVNGGIREAIPLFRSPTTPDVEVRTIDGLPLVRTVRGALGSPTDTYAFIE